uniref:VWFA domain-containing protein n=1 Tax=viral metagenome TaxID=1070528 RepID=A0A6C0E041_9ZZZZ
MESDKVLSVVFILDNSGSMVEMKDEPIQGLNAFYKTQKEAGDFLSTLIFFNSKVSFIHKNLNGKDVPLLSEKDYGPNGMTALYDAIGEGIEYQKSQKVENVIVVILTDGEENASLKYTKKDIKKMTQKMEEDHKWVFMYLGANQDSFKVADGIGVSYSANYDYTPEGCRRVMRSISDNVSRCISSKEPSVTFKVDLSQQNAISDTSPPPLDLPPSFLFQRM